MGLIGLLFKGIFLGRRMTKRPRKPVQKEYYLHTIECFGPNRCMFESNYPVDRLSISYHVLWNGFKKIVAEFSEDEKDIMFSGTATRVYSL